MSFLSGNTKAKAEPEQAALGVPPQELATNEKARPVPVFYGSPMLGVTFLSQGFNQFALPRKEDFGKEKRVIGYNYYCSFACLIAQGPVDRIDQIYFDGVKVWPNLDDPGLTRDRTVDKLVSVRVIGPGTGYNETTVVTPSSGGAVLRPVVRDGKLVEVIVDDEGSGYSAGSPPTISATVGSGATFEVVIGSETWVPITIAYQGVTFMWRFHWGMEDCDYDPVLLQLSSDPMRNSLSPTVPRNSSGVAGENEAEDHPAYTGQCYFVAVNQYLGYNQTNVQQITIVARRIPQASWFTSSAGIGDEANLVHCIAEDLTNTRYGLGMVTDRLNEVNLDAIANEVESDSLAVSPIITETRTFREYLTAALEYVDGYQFADELGRFCLGLVREVACETEDISTPYYDEASLMSPPKFDPTSWDDTLNYIHVTFTNRTSQWRSDQMGAPNRANLQITQEPSEKTLAREWFTSPAVVDLYLRAVVQMYGLPLQSGRITVRKSKLQGLQLGGIFKLQYGHLALCYLWCRAKEIRFGNPYRPEVDVLFEVDRGFLVQHTYRAPDYVPPIQISHTVDGIVNKLLFELPYMENLATPGAPHLLALVQRPTQLTTGFKVYTIENASAKDIKTCQNFAFHGTVYYDYTQASAGFFYVTLDGVDQTLPAIDDGDPDAAGWLLIVNQEVMVVTDQVLDGSSINRYKLTVSRERLDSRRDHHTAGDTVWIISKADASGCVVDQSDTVVTPWVNGNTVEFKLQPFVLGTGQDLADITADSVPFTGRADRQWKPRDMAVNSVKWWDGPTYGTGDDIVITWTPNNRNAPRGWEPDLPDIWYIEVRLMDETFVRQFHRAADVDTLTVSNADLIAAIGGETDFKVVIYARSGTSSVVDSRYYDEATVTKV